MSLTSLLQSIFQVPKSSPSYGTGAIGPKPTPNPPPNVSYTPQMSGSTVEQYAGPAFGPQYRPPANWYTKSSTPNAPAVTTNQPPANDNKSSGSGGNSGSSGSSGGGGSTLSYLGGNTSLGDSSVNPYAGLEAAAQLGDQAARDQLDSLYAERNSQLNDQLGYNETQKANTLSELDRQLQEYFGGVDKQKVQVGEDTASAIDQSGQTARSTQRANRNVLRGIGILNSTYAADQLNAPINEFDKQRAVLQKWGLTESAKLDEAKLSKQREADAQKNQILAQFNELAGKIQSDIRFNEKEKIGAYKQAQAALAQRLAEIQASKVNYENQINQTKQAFLSDLVKLQLTQSPKADISGILSKSMATLGQVYGSQQPSNVGIYQEPKKKLSNTGA